MKQTIIVIGGGISGLATLHFLNKKYADRDDCEIFLLERNPTVGGVLNTEMDVGARFETGGSSFINNQPKTFELIDDLGIRAQVIQANPENKRRYICMQQKLIELPNHPGELFKFPLLDWKDKWKIITETSTKAGGFPDETMHEFVVRRFSRKVADILADPAVSGIYAGDIKSLILKRAFPKIYQFEQDHGSVIRGMRRNRDKSAPKKTIQSFKNGMGELIRALQHKYHGQIVTRCEVESIRTEGKDSYGLVTQDQIYRADQVFLTLPAYRCANIVLGLNKTLSEYLNAITYAPLALVGFVCSKNDFLRLPKGFGYLKPSMEGSPVLGVLFEDQIFDNRSQSDQCLLRLMIGGMHHPDILKYSKKEIIGIARREIVQTLGFKGEPYHIFFKAWNKAIPQFDMVHHQTVPLIENVMTEYGQLILSGNYWGGVSINDCINHAFKSVEASSL